MYASVSKQYFEHTFLGLSSPLMHFQFVIAPFPSNRSIASRFRKVQHHRLIEELEPLHLFYRPGSSSRIIEDDESLAFGFEVGLGDEVDDITVLGEYFAEGFFELVDLYSLFEILDL